MYLKYGSYTYEAPAWITRSTERVRDQKRRAYLDVHRLVAESRIYAATEAGFVSDIAALESAHAEDDHDLILRWPDGTETDLDVDSDDMLGGVRVVSPPVAPRTGAIEYAPGAYWPFRVEYEWIEELVTSGDFNVIGFEETTSRTVGEDKARKVVDEVISGRGRTHSVCQHPVCTVRQAGRVVGWFSFPEIPDPLWPDYQIEPVRITERRGPIERYGTVGRRYEIGYSYTFAASEVLEELASDWPES